ncbi:uncharacterized protein LOC142159948 isoform X2 [Mixophyes fleayi]|uniref:uncharacterized protein LOC142159948 isoform X2 n=1 Tax=Mixophyes fleayi TaxID=3061075 RepID=UPI003F4D94BA
MMDKDRSHMIEKVLNLTLEIIYLLTLEDYIVVKKTSGELMTPSTRPRVSGGSSRTQSPITEPPPHSLIHERNNDHKVLELTNKIIQLLTGEDEDLIDIKVEEIDEEEETYVWDDQLCKEEEIPTDISTDGHNSSTTLEEHLLISTCKIEDDDITQDSPGENTTTINIYPVLHSADGSSDPSNHEECSPDKSGQVTHSTARRGRKTYQCSECDKYFTQNADLTRHHRVHTGEKPFLCSECGKCFTQKSALAYHKRIHTGAKPFPCIDCGKCFAHKSTLVNHQRVHTGEKPFSCSDCGKCFAYKSYLVDHQRIHTGVKPFLCSECNKYFAHKSDLNRHKKIHTGEKPFSCSECGRSFTQKVNLLMHQKIHKVKKNKLHALKDTKQDYSST